MRERRLLTRRLVLGGIGIVVILFLLTSARLFVWPPRARVTKADAILVLNGTYESARRNLAISLAERGYAPVLLFSQGTSRTTACPRVPGTQVICFVPVPGRTIGEVGWAVRTAASRGWSSLLVVAGRAQATRARVLMARCFPGRATVVPARAQLLHLPFEVVYEWAALSRAILAERDCS